ncbi:MAG: TIM barrel protein [Planctomycetes bacterium]|nr:TIM barrel protein [Planctomycetota bacterium]
MNSPQPITRRVALQSGLATAAGVVLTPVARADDKPAAAKKPTEFQIACMTLPYSAYPLRRALTGLKSAGYRYIAWGTRHVEVGGQRVPVMAADAPPAKAKELANRCRGMGLQTLMMFSGIYPEHRDGLKVLTHRLKQAAAGDVAHVLTFGHTKGGNRKLWIERFKKLGPIARDLGVLLVVKQHGGSTGTGQACAEIIREVDDPGVMVNYDAGNVMDYLNVDPTADIKKCADVVRSFCIKDHRNWPKDQDCGPGFGEIDHYRLLHPVAWTGRKMPLCSENIFAPVVARPTKPEGVDALAERARKFLEVVTRGLQA